MTAHTIPGVVREAAERFGDLEAVVDNDRRMTFAGVLDAVVGVQRALIGWGVKPGDRVAIWAPNGLDWVLLSFGVYGVGAVLVPINTRYKGEEATYVLEAAGATLLFTVTDFLGTDYPELLAGVVPEDQRPRTVIMSGAVPASAVSWAEFLEGGEDVPVDQAEDRLSAVEADDPSDIVFTSGTTGLPKGAVLRHGASVETYRQWTRA
ncbi:MAG TPA: AMP-binding protein, partial [Acidimicrobiales bacterium]|nr:AMP-binding protein [Acidimicrobiales bacterium]